MSFNGYGGSMNGNFNLTQAMSTTYSQTTVNNDNDHTLYLSDSEENRAILIVVGVTFAIFIVLGLCLFLCIPRSCTICWINCLRWHYNWCCFRLDCASKLDVEAAILRYEEDPPMQKEEFIENITSNEYIYGLLSSLNKELPEYFFSILPSGSLREGFGKVLPSTAVLATDYDVMLVPDAVMVGEDGIELDGKEKPVFAITETSEIKTGYLWLCLKNDYLSQWEKLCIRRQTKGRGCSYLSTTKIHDLIQHTVMMGDDINNVVTKQLKGKAADIAMEQNGPALTIKVTTDRKLACGCRCKCSCCELERDDLLFYCDLTVALHCPHWPKKAQGWFTTIRRTHWPSQDVVDQIKIIGCHVVPKPSTKELVKLHEEQPLCTTYSQSPGLEWRFSFSQPEILLAENIPPEARSAHLALKAVNKRHISYGMEEGQGLPSYVLKCILFRIVEETDAEYWSTKPSIGEIFTRLLDALCDGLKEGKYPHYWIDTIDLLDDIDPVTKRTLQFRAERVRYRPQAYIADNWLELTRCLRVNCCLCCSSGKAKQVVRRARKRCCPCCLIPYSYKDTMFCCGPCPYERLTMDVY